jgi:hypothetical protein
LIDFDEPFGLSVVEAMVCGTPVIAFDRGSMPELIVDGKTGSLVSDVASAAAAIMRVGQLDRRTIRDMAVQRFSGDRMIDAYVGVYQHAIAECQLRSTGGSAEAGTVFGPSQRCSLLEPWEQAQLPARRICARHLGSRSKPIDRRSRGYVICRT